MSSINFYDKNVRKETRISLEKVSRKKSVKILDFLWMSNAADDDAGGTGMLKFLGLKILVTVKTWRNFCVLTSSNVIRSSTTPFQILGIFFWGCLEYVMDCGTCSKQFPVLNLNF